MINDTRGTKAGAEPLEGNNDAIPQLVLLLVQVTASDLDPDETVPLLSATDIRGSVGESCLTVVPVDAVMPPLFAKKPATNQQLLPTTVVVAVMVVLIFCPAASKALLSIGDVWSTPVYEADTPHT